MALGFDGFSEAALETDGGRVFGNFDTASVNQDLEPEYMAVSPDGRFAFVTLQEINAVANATSGTTTLYSISAVPVPGAVALLAIGLYRLRGRHTANPG